MPLTNTNRNAIPVPLVAIPPAVRQPMPGHRGEDDKLP